MLQPLRIPPPVPGHYRLPQPLRRVARGLAAVLIGAALTACGGGDGGDTGDGAPARIEIVQTGLLFTARGQTRQLEARVFDAADQRIEHAVRWSSSDTGDILVSDSGLASAEGAAGSSQIVASIGELHSAPLLAVVTPVADGTVLVDDPQIVQGARETDPQAEPGLDNTYSVVVAGLAAPATGTLMVGTGSQPLAGRVVTTREVAGGLEITLKLVPLAALFPQLELNQVFDLSQAPVEIPAEIAADYAVSRDGNTYSFTPRDTTAKAVGQPAGTSTLGKGCTTTIPNFQEGSPLPITIPVPPVLRITINPSLDVLYTSARGLERLLVKASPVAAVEGGLNVVAAFEGKVECKADLFVFRVPIGGALSFILSGLVPVGVSLEAGGKITVGTMGIGFKNETRFNTRIGMECAGECDFVGELSDFGNVVTPKLDLPGIGDLRLEPSVLASATVSASLGNPFLKSLRFSSFEAKAGPRLLGSFAPQLTQISDSTYKSNYRITAEFKAGLGTGIQNVLNLLGILKLTGFEFVSSTDLTKSPAGTLSADKSSFVTGETVRFQLALDRASTEFLGVYNVEEVLLVRNSGGQHEVARVTAGDGDTDFSFSFTAPNAGDSSEFFAFVITRLLPADFLSLELGNVVGSSGATLLRARADADARATRCTQFSNCETAAGSTQFDDSLISPGRNRYAADAGNAAGVGANASGRASMSVPLEAGGILQSAALECAGDASITGRTGADFANNLETIALAFEIPPGAPMRYDFVAAAPSLAAADFSGANAFVALMPDPEGDLFPLIPEGTSPVFEMFRDEGHPLRQNALLLFGNEEGVTAYDGIAEQGGRSGALTPGRYTLAIACFSGGGTGTGAAGHSYQVTLNLSR